MKWYFLVCTANNLHILRLINYGGMLKVKVLATIIVANKKQILYQLLEKTYGFSSITKYVSCIGGILCGILAVDKMAYKEMAK